MRNLPVVTHRSRTGVALVSLMALATAAVAGCSGARPAAAPAASPPPPAAAAPAQRSIPDPVLTLHWSDALDTTRVLEARPDQRLRVAVTITGVDTLQGYTLRFRLEPIATWLFTAEPDPQAPAPWPNKLLITDLKPAPDGTVWMLVAAGWDKVVLDPDSLYSLCHLDFDPPVAAEEGGSCAGWDGPARLYCESGELALTSIEFPVQRLGLAVTVRPLAAPKP